MKKEIGLGKVIHGANHTEAGVCEHFSCLLIILSVLSLVMFALRMTILSSPAR